MKLLSSETSEKIFTLNDAEWEVEETVDSIEELMHLALGLPRAPSDENIYFEFSVNGREDVLTFTGELMVYFTHDTFDEAVNASEDNDIEAAHRSNNKYRIYNIIWTSRDIIYSDEDEFEALVNTYEVLFSAKRS